MLQRGEQRLPQDRFQVGAGERLLRRRTQRRVHEEKRLRCSSLRPATRAGKEREMTLYGRSSKWATALALGLAGLIGAGAALVLAAPARSAASAFELRLEGTATLTLPPGGWLGITSQGTFTSQAPFCAAGTFTDPDNLYDAVIARRFTCDDGTGSLTL